MRYFNHPTTFVTKQPVDKMTDIVESETTESETIDILNYPESEFLFHISHVYSALNKPLFQDVLKTELTSDLEYVITKDLTIHKLKLMPIASANNISDDEIILSFNNIPKQGDNEAATKLTSLRNISCKKTVLDVILGAFIIQYKYQGTISITAPDSSVEIYGVEKIETTDIDIGTNLEL